MSTNTVMGIYQFDEPTKSRFGNVVRPLVETHTGLTYVDAMSYYEAAAVKIDLISQMIRDARLIIADISAKNPNVFTELGIAFASGKPIVVLCSRTAWEDKQAAGWNATPPFDLQGRELLIYSNDRDLRVQLGRHISDCLHKTAQSALAWDSLSAYNHVRSSDSLEISTPGRVWTALDRAVGPNFVLSYHVKIHSQTSGLGSHPDLRLYLSTAPERYPCIAVVFPWQASERDPEKLECIVTYFSGTDQGTLTPQDEAAYGPMPVNTTYDGRAQRHLRLQQIAVGSKRTLPFEYDVFLSFCWPNLVFESTLFEDEVERLCVSLSSLRALGYPTHLQQYVGFESVNSRASISSIALKQIALQA